MPGTKQLCPRSDWIDASRLWIVLDRNAASPLCLPEVTTQAINGGVDVVLCRIKDASDDEVRSISTEVRAICAQAGIPFVMSHHPELAAQLNADAVQLGVGDPDMQEVRQIIGPTMPIGYSTHSVAEAKQSFAEGAAYVFLGPIYPTPQKLKYGEPLGMHTVSAASELPGPVVFIGGINQENACELIARGAKRIAAIAALQHAADIELSARNLKRELLSAIRGG